MPPYAKTKGLGSFFINKINTDNVRLSVLEWKEAPTFQTKQQKEEGNILSRLHMTSQCDQSTQVVKTMIDYPVGTPLLSVIIPNKGNFLIGMVLNKAL